MTLENYRLFKAEIRKQLELKGWRYADLAAATGYKTSTIECFMSNCRVTGNVAEAIAKALDIPAHMAT